MAEAAYCTTEDVTAQGLDGLSSQDAGVISSVILAASRWFDRAAEVPANYFEQAAELEGEEDGLSERIYYGDGTNYLRLSPFVPDSIPEDGGVVLPDAYSQMSYVIRTDGEQFTLERAYDGETQPLSLLSPVGWGVGVGSYVDNRFLQYRTGWPVGAPVTVTARWGWEATPSDVKQAVIRRVVYLLRSPDEAYRKVADLDNRAPVDELWESVTEKWRMRGLMFG